MSKEFEHPTEAELEILQVLWNHGPSTVRFVHESLGKHQRVGYTTTLKQMQRMFEKEWLVRNEDSKPHYYEAILPEEKVKESLLQKFVDKTFQGSALDLVMHALGSSDTTLEELDQLQAWLDEKKKGGES